MIVLEAWLWCLLIFLGIISIPVASILSH
jgi:hypothetical protein